MSKEFKEFKFKGFNLRCVEHEGVAWFMAKDICDVLGTTVSNVRRVVEKEDVLNVYEIHVEHSGSGRPPLVISKSGFFDMVFRSNKKLANDFRKWVTHEVLPSIEETGGYVGDPNATVEDFESMKVSSEKNRELFRNPVQRSISSEEFSSIFAPLLETNKEISFHSRVNNYALLTNDVLKTRIKSIVNHMAKNIPDEQKSVYINLYNKFYESTAMFIPPKSQSGISKLEWISDREMLPELLATAEDMRREVCA